MCGFLLYISGERERERDWERLLLGLCMNSRLSEHRYTLQSRDLDTQKAFDTSDANDQLINLIFNGVKSPFENIIYRLDILFKPNLIIINLT